MGAATADPHIDGGDGMSKLAPNVNDQMLAEEFRRGLRIVGPHCRIVSRDLEFMFGGGDDVGAALTDMRRDEAKEIH